MKAKKRIDDSTNEEESTDAMAEYLNCAQNFENMCDMRGKFGKQFRKICISRFQKCQDKVKNFYFFWLNFF